MAIRSVDVAGFLSCDVGKKRIIIQKRRKANEGIE